jgi:hypothetical protein
LLTIEKFEKAWKECPLFLANIALSIAYTYSPGWEKSTVLPKEYGFWTPDSVRPSIAEIIDNTPDILETRRFEYPDICMKDGFFHLRYQNVHGRIYIDVFRTYAEVRGAYIHASRDHADVRSPSYSSEYYLLAESTFSKSDRTPYTAIRNGLRNTPGIKVVDNPNKSILHSRNLRSLVSKAENRADLFLLISSPS